MPSHESGIIRTRKNGNFSILNNATFSDTRLSYAARGLLAYLLTRPDNWETRFENLIRMGKEDGSDLKRDGIRAKLRELEAIGYMKRTKEHGSGGKWRWITEVYDTPVDTYDETQTEPDTSTDRTYQPSTAQPSMAEPSTAEAGIYKVLNEISTESKKDGVKDSSRFLQKSREEMETDPIPEWGNEATTVMGLPEPVAESGGELFDGEDGGGDKTPVVAPKPIRLPTGVRGQANERLRDALPDSYKLAAREAFDRLWSVYPARQTDSGAYTKGSKQEAWFWFLCLRSEEWDAVIAAAENYAASGRVARDCLRFVNSDGYWREYTVLEDYSKEVGHGTIQRNGGFQGGDSGGAQGRRGSARGPQNGAVAQSDAARDYLERRQKGSPW